jgi:hypothetical protein
MSWSLETHVVVFINGGYLRRKWKIVGRRAANNIFEI